MQMLRNPPQQTLPIRISEFTGTFPRTPEGYNNRAIVAGRLNVLLGRTVTNNLASNIPGAFAHLWRTLIGINF